MGPRLRGDGAKDDAVAPLFRRHDFQATLAPHCHTGSEAHENDHP
jgi:hypothetical protein